MEPYCSLPCSQQPPNYFSCLRHTKSASSHSTYFLRSNTILPSIARSSKLFSPWGYLIKSLYVLLLCPIHAARSTTPTSLDFIRYLWNDGLSSLSPLTNGPSVHHRIISSAFRASCSITVAVYKRLMGVKQSLASHEGMESQLHLFIP
jgi:hypothetical protein